MLIYQSAVPTSFLLAVVLFSIVAAVGATVFSFEHDVNMPMLAISNATAMIDFFMMI